MASKDNGGMTLEQVRVREKRNNLEEIRAIESRVKRLDYTFYILIAVITSIVSTWLANTD